MKRLDRIPDALAGRAGRDAVPFKCDCGVTLLWHPRNGPVVCCPSCRVLGEVGTDAPAAQVVPDPSIRDMAEVQRQLAAAWGELRNRKID